MSLSWVPDLMNDPDFRNRKKLAHQFPEWVPVIWGQNDIVIVGTDLT